MSFFDLPLEDLRALRPERDEPADFGAFWSATLAEAAERPVDAVFTPVDALLPHVRVEDVRFTGHGGTRVAGWFLAPRGADEPLPCVVVYAGYSGGRGLPHQWLTWPAAGYALLVMDSRGQGDGDTDDLPADACPQSAGLITRGVLQRETYYYRRLFTDAVRAVDAARAHPLTDPDRLVVAGGSQGGAMAQAVAGLRDDLRGALIDVPFMTHVRHATEITDAIPYAELSTLFATKPALTDRVLETLRSFDGVHFAARATVPALYSVGLADEVCPPSCVFAGYHHYAGPKDIRVWPYNGHEGGGVRQLRLQLEWVRDLPAD